MLRLLVLLHAPCLYETHTAPFVVCPLTCSIPPAHRTSLFMLLLCKCSQHYYVTRHIHETSPHTNIIPIITTYHLSLSLHIAQNRTSNHHSLPRLTEPEVTHTPPNPWQTKQHFHDLAWPSQVD